MSTQPVTNLEEVVVALAPDLTDEGLKKASAGEFGPEARLLTMAEKVRRASQKPVSGSAA